MPLTARILLGLVAGLGLGILLAIGQPSMLGAVVDGAGVVGHLWLNGLQMTIVPLVFALLVTGVASAAGTARGGGIAARAVLLFAVLLTVAACLSAVLAPLFLRIAPVPASAAAALQGTLAGAVPPFPPLGEWLLSFIPTNPVKAAAGDAMVPIVLFALVFGLAVNRLEQEPRQRLVALFDAIVQAMLVIVGWVLWLAPFGVFALALVVGVTAGTDAAGALLHYVLVVIAVMIVLLAATYLFVLAFGRIGLRDFARAAAGPQLVALGTQSSLATLPAMVKAAKETLGVPEPVRDTVLPLAVSLFRITNPAANMAVAVYVAALSGVELGVPQLVAGALVAALVSLAAVGLPGQVSFFTTIGPICLAMGVPIAVLPLLLAVESLPDLFRTVGNVTADLAVTRVIGARTPDGRA